jgi:heme A synthase
VIRQLVGFAITSVPIGVWAVSIAFVLAVVALVAFLGYVMVKTLREPDPETRRVAQAMFHDLLTALLALLAATRRSRRSPQQSSRTGRRKR